MSDVFLFGWGRIAIGDSCLVDWNDIFGIFVGPPDPCDFPGKIRKIIRTGDFLLPSKKTRETWYWYMNFSSLLLTGRAQDVDFRRKPPILAYSPLGGWVNTGRFGKILSLAQF